MVVSVSRVVIAAVMVCAGAHPGFSQGGGRIFVYV